MKENKQYTKKPNNLHRLLKGRAAKYGDRIFVWDKWKSITFIPHSYNDFFADIQALATFLIKSGFKGSNIMLFSENCYYWMITNYAIASYVGTSVGANKDWQDYDVINALKTVDIKVIIYSEKNRPIIDKISPVCKDILFLSMNEVADIICLRRNIKSPEDKGLLVKNIQPSDQISQIIFTTGSSGLPKAVPLAYKNMECCIPMFLSRFPINDRDIQFSFLPLSHIFGNMVTLFSFYTGVTLYLCSDVTLIKDEIKIAKPTIICGVPLFFDRIYAGIGPEKVDKINKVAMITGPLARVGLDLRKIAFKELYNFFGGKLKYVICGAAPLDFKVKKLFLDIGVNFVEAYGMSETAAYLTMEKFGEQIANSVGQVFSEMECKLININEFGQGEVVIKGPNVFRGYYVGSAIEKPACDSEGFFHTGDLGRFDDKGRLFLTGRKKRLILTSNGENVSPDEMEKHFGERLAVKRVKIYNMDNQIAITIYAGDSEPRSDAALRGIITQVNHTLPKFKRIRKIFINRSSVESSVK